MSVFKYLVISSLVLSPLTSFAYTAKANVTITNSLESAVIAKFSTSSCCTVITTKKMSISGGNGTGESSFKMSMPYLKHRTYTDTIMILSSANQPICTIAFKATTYVNFFGQQTITMEQPFPYIDKQHSGFTCNASYPAYDGTTVKINIKISKS